MAKPIALTDATFEQQALQSETPVVVDFWAPWCPPCRAVAPILDELAGEYEGKLKVAKVNVDEDSAWAGKFGVMAIPTMIIFKGGQEVGRIQGALPKPKLQAAFDKAINS